MENTDKKQDFDLSKFTMLEQSLGQKLTTQEVATYLGLDEDTIRKYYQQYGGIRPTGPKGRILFFEKNIVDALSRSKDYAIEYNEERTNSMERESPEKRTNQTEIIQNEKGGIGLGSSRKKKRLVEDRHGIFDA